MFSESAELQYDTTWCLTGTLYTATPDRVQAVLTTEYPVGPHDQERSNHCTISDDSQITVDFRQDCEVDESTLVQQILSAAPDATGSLTFQMPYTEVQEALFPMDLQFEGAGGASVFQYHLVKESQASRHCEPPAP